MPFLFFNLPRRKCGYCSHVNVQRELLCARNYFWMEIKKYVDGVLAADDFCKGMSCEVSISYLLNYGNNVKILISEMKENSCYMEAGEDRGLHLRDIRWIPCVFLYLQIKIQTNNLCLIKSLKIAVTITAIRLMSTRSVLVPPGVNVSGGISTQSKPAEIKGGSYNV